LQGGPLVGAGIVQAQSHANDVVWTKERAADAKQRRPAGREVLELRIDHEILDLDLHCG
jgi:hypothetical protein